VARARSVGQYAADMAVSGQGPSLQDMVNHYAPQYGVDPVAAMQVSQVEGGGRFGAVGDQGTSFGPWQLHIGGAMPAQYATPTAAAAFANSEAGVRYVLEHMGRVAGGLKGRAAVEAIVRRFERPADPTGEVARALGQTGMAGAGSYAAPGVAARVSGAMSPPKLPSVGFSQGLTNSLNSLMSGGASQDPGAQLLAQTLARQKTFGSQLQRSLSAMAPKQVPGAAVADVSQATPSSATWLRPGAKIIGTPYQGTHTVGNWQSDNAVDIALPVGTPIFAPVAGKLGNTGLLSGQGASGGGRFSGERINLFGGGQGFYFAHLSQLAPGIRQGAQVKAGQLLGYTGEANGVAHLHFGVENGDPRSYYG